MNRFVLIALLAACGDKREAPAPTASLPLPTVSTPLSEAKQLLAVGRRDPTAWVALAHAQVVAKLPEALATLDAALSAARADTSREGAQALAFAVEVLDALGDTGGAAKLLDEAIARIAKDPDRDAILRLLRSPASHLTHASTKERLALLANEGKAPVVVLVERAAEERRAGKPNVSIVEEAAKLASETDEKILVALEAAVSGAPALAKKMVEGIPKLAHSQEAAERAETFAVLAAIHALANDKPGSQAFEKKSLQAVEKDSEEIDDDDIWIFLGLARAKRGEVDGAIELVKERLKDKHAAAKIAHDLTDAGELEAVKQILGAIDGEARWRATTDVVERLATTNLDAARQLATAGPMWKMKLPGLEHVLRAYALRGDVASVHALGTETRQQIDAFVDLAARMLARQGKCGEAVVAIKGVTVNRGEGLAVIARYCPDSKL
ncbi:MAG: hypothetical protein M4D80_10405 [Myxococcota bacterium]|nr:hypothetical protein [Deltaproteobacteria bacterium]MDQ3335567.1 hypothetical protein [Myxococcota bacterium]